jgi:hypothetical protein
LLLLSELLCTSLALLSRASRSSWRCRERQQQIRNISHHAPLEKGDDSRSAPAPFLWHSAFAGHLQGDQSYWFPQHDKKLTAAVSACRKVYLYDHWNCLLQGPNRGPWRVLDVHSCDAFVMPPLVSLTD